MAHKIVAGVWRPVQSPASHRRNLRRRGSSIGKISGPSKPQCCGSARPAPIGADSFTWRWSMPGGRLAPATRCRTTAPGCGEACGVPGPDGQRLGAEGCDS